MPELVVVSGAPGAGKSTLAVPLARALGFPLGSLVEVDTTAEADVASIAARVQASVRRQREVPGP